MTDAEIDAHIEDIKARYRARRETRRAELAAAIRAGRRIFEARHDGQGTIWPDAYPVMCEQWGPDRLAAHVEAREEAFGFAAEIMVD
jgi:hypothetical protein